MTTPRKPSIKSVNLISKRIKIKDAVTQLRQKVSQYFEHWHEKSIRKL